MKIGVIGVGRWGKKILNNINEISDIEQICYRDNPETKLWLDEYFSNTKITQNYKELLDNNNIETIVIATPISSHFQIAKDSILAGKNVFIEKPIASNVRECEELLNIKTHVKIFIGHIFLFNPAFIYLKKKLRNEDIESIEMSWNKYGSFEESIILNLLSHEISIVGDLIGFNFSDTQVNRAEKQITNLDILEISFLVNEKIRCNININRVSHQKSKELSVYCKSGVIYRLSGQELFQASEKEENLQLIYKDNKDLIKSEFLSFFNSILGKGEIIPDRQFGLNILKSLEYIDSILT